MVVDNLLGGALNSIGMLPTEHNDPINEKILAISEDSNFKTYRIDVVGPESNFMAYKSVL
jgi:hypothetical protein